MKTVQLNSAANDVLNEMTAQFLEKVCSLYGHQVHIEDTDWQVVYDLKLDIINRIEGLGLKIEDNL